MSTFLTPVPLQLDKIKALMPTGSTVDRVVYNEKTQQVEVHWRNIRMQTKYSWPWLWSIEQLEKKQIPEGVTPHAHTVASATNCLTDSRESPKNPNVEKMAGKTNHETGARRVASGAQNSKVGARRSKPAARISQRSERETNPKATGGTPTDSAASTPDVDRDRPEPVAGVLAEQHG